MGPQHECIDPILNLSLQGMHDMHAYTSSYLLRHRYWQNNMGYSWYLSCDMICKLVMCQWYICHPNVQLHVACRRIYWRCCAGYAVAECPSAPPELIITCFVSFLRAMMDGKQELDFGIWNVIERSCLKWHFSMGSRFLPWTTLDAYSSVEQKTPTIWWGICGNLWQFVHYCSWYNLIP